MTARPFDSDAAYEYHPRAAVIHYEPLPADAMRQLQRLARLIRTAPNEDELEWLQEQQALVLAECDDCPPVPVRNVNPPPPRKPRKRVWFNSRGRRA